MMRVIRFPGRRWLKLVLAVFAACGLTAAGQAGPHNDLAGALLFRPPANRPPVIGQAPDQKMAEDGSLSVPIQVNDGETGADSVLVTAGAADRTLVPPALLTVTGKGPARTLLIKPAPDRHGATEITVVASDGLLAAKMSFRLSVAPVNDAPVIARIAPVDLDEDEPSGPIRFTVADAESEAGTLGVAVIDSSNPKVIPLANIGVGGTGGDRVVFFKPAPNAFGQSIIALRVSDGEQSATTTFAATVRPVNDPPEISEIRDLAVRPGTIVPALAFTVGDIESGAAPLVLAQNSSNPALLPLENIGFEGAGADRAVILRPVKGGQGASRVTVIVMDPQGGKAATSFEFVVTDATLGIAAQPESQSVSEGAPAQFEVRALGNGSLKFQWLFNGRPMPRETNSVLNIKSAQMSDMGIYQVRVGDSSSTVVSREAKLRVTRQIVIEAQPLPLTVPAGANAAFTVKASGAEPIFYQWYFNGAIVPDGTSATLVIPSAQARDAGTYTAILKNVAGERASAGAVLAVREPLRFTLEVEDQIVREGGTITLEPAVKGAGLVYQWYFQGKPIDATGPFYIKEKATRADSGDYRLEVRGADGAAFSRAIRVIVVAAPTIAKQPVDRIVVAGRGTQLSVVASGTEPLIYEWFKDGTAVATTKIASLELTNVTTADQGKYTVQVSNLAGEALSEAATVTVVEGLRIATQPADLARAAGESATLSVEASGKDLSYQWFYRGVPIPGATGAAYTIPKAGVADSGDYSVAIANAAGALRSTAVKLEILAPPLITHQPRSQNGLAGGVARFVVAVNGSEPLTYQWSVNGVPIANASAPVLSLSGLQERDEGEYRVQVRNGAGSVVSEAATLQVIRPVQITGQPVGGRIRAGNSLLLASSATGSGPLRFQWQRDGMDIPGANSPGFAAREPGKYAVRIANPAGAVLSDPALVEVLQPVTFRVQPKPVAAKAGESAVLRAETEGSGKLAYQWQFNGQDIPGATGETLLVPDARAAAAGTYRVLVSNELGSVLSSEVRLDLLAGPVIASPPQTQTVAIGTDVRMSVTAEGAPPLAYQWALNGAAIPGATGPALTIANAQPANSGRYTVVVSNPGGVARAGAVLVVQTPSLALSDNRADAPTLTLASGVFRGSNAGATSEPGEPGHAPKQSARASVWFSWVAPGDGVVSFTTEGSSFDTILAAYAVGAQAQLDLQAGNEDSGRFKTSAIQMNAAQGTTYFIAIDGYKGATGDIVIRWNLEPKQPRLPRISRQPVGFTALIGRAAQFSVGAAPADAAGLGYQWFHFDTPLPGQNAAVLDLANVAPADVGRYSVLVTSAGDPSFAVRSDSAELQINLIETRLEGPEVNTGDKPDLANRPLLPQRIGTRPIRILQSVARGYTGSQIFSTVGSVTDENEPSHCSVTGGASSWSLYEAPASGSLLVTTEGSSFDTVLAIYKGTGDDFASMIPLGCDNDSGADGQDSRIVVPVNAGELIFIVVDGVNGASGMVQLNYTLSAPPAFTQQPRVAGIQPAAASQQAPEGATVTLEVAATSVAPVSYQWLRNGQTLANATNATLVVSGFGAGNAGHYTAVVSNFAGDAYSEELNLDVLLGASIVTPPQNQNAVAGGSAVFTVAANGTAPLQYEWRFNGALLPGETAATLALLNVQANQAGAYEVRVSNSAGSVTAQASLTVLEPVVITQQPGSRQAGQGQSATLNVAATGSPALGYQWRFNGVDLPGQNAAQLTLQNLVLQNSGSYSVVVNNAVSTALSAPAQVEVVVPVAIMQQPQSQTVSGAASAQFEVIASGTEPVAYQWRFNGAAIPGATARVLVLDPLTPASAGNYSVVANNAAAVPVISQEASLALTAAPTISQQPQSQSVPVGGSAAFTVSAAGSGALNYQWRFNGVNLPGQNAPSLALTGLTAGAAGAYTVAIDNTVGSIVSAPAELSVNSPIVIVQQPASQTMLEGSLVSFTVLATGTGPLAYRWLKNEIALPDATNETLTLAAVEAGDAGNYRAQVSNPGGTNLSAAAVLTVQELPQILTQPAPALVPPGAAAQFTLLAGGTAPLSYQWRFNGVNLPAETNATLQIAAAAPEDEGDYSVLVGNPAGALASALAPLTINRSDVLLSARMEGPEVVVRITGPLGREVSLEASQNLGDWAEVGSITLDGGEGESRGPAVGVFRFYRARLEP